MADKPVRALSRNAQKVTRMEMPQSSSKRQPVSHEGGDSKTMTEGRDKAAKSEGRKAKPELALYRPGMGLAQKGRGPRNGDRKPQVAETVASFEELTVGDRPSNRNARSKRPDQQVYVPKQVKPGQPEQKVSESGQPKECGDSNCKTITSPELSGRLPSSSTTVTKEQEAAAKTPEGRHLPSGEVGSGDFGGPGRNNSGGGRRPREARGPAGDGNAVPGQNRGPPPGRRPGNPEDGQQRWNRQSGRKKKHRHRDDLEKGHETTTPITASEVGEEEDWEGDLLVVTRSATHVPNGTQEKARAEERRDEDSKIPTEPLVRDWSAEVEREEENQSCGSERPKPVDGHRTAAPPRREAPPRLQSPGEVPGKGGGLLRIPGKSVHSPPMVATLEDRESVSSGGDKPLIAVKPQPQVLAEATYAVPPYEPPLQPPYRGTSMVPYDALRGTVAAIPVYQSDQIVAADIYGRGRIKPLVEKNLHDAALLEREYMTYLSKGVQNADLKAMGHCRWKLQLRYENVILADPRYCAERNVEQALWKSAFYQGIETFRRIAEDCPDYAEEAKSHLLTLVDEGTVFYENLLDKFQETYGFSLSPFLKAEGAPRPPGLPDSIRLVLISAQKIYICLGDLARYREQALGTTNYGRARNYYLKAQQLAPKNGRPYNQLAILAIYARRKLDAVYFYMRSLAASNPFLTARESLLALFDEARKKYEHVEKKRRDEEGKRAESRSTHRRLSDLGDERLEVWIRPDGTSSHRSSRSSSDRIEDNREDELGELDRLTTVDLNKRFVLSFLHVHGKLFTRVGMESFSETAQRMLMEFRCLLQRSPAAVASARHLQLMSINMFTVANTSLKDSSLDPQCRSLLQEQSLQVALAHVAILLERAAALLQQQEPDGRLPDDALELLPALKIWTDWMSCQKRLWSPPPTPCDYCTSVKGNVWTTLADLLTVLRTTNLGNVKLYKEPAEDREPVTLPEDSTLAGFVPLLGAPQENYYVTVPCDMELARNYLRISRIQFFGDYLCGIATPYLEFNVEKKRFVSLITVSDDDSDSEREITYDSSDDDLELGDSLDDQDVSLRSEEDDNEIQKLWSKKEQLRKAKEQRDRQQACVQAVLQEHRSKQATMLEIRPRYLFPDTNCFIDHLPLLQRLVADGHFHVYVPLVVVNELDGLARGTRQSLHQSAEHQKKVATTAKAALNYLQDRFAHREPKLRCVTSRGSVLDTMSFRSEDVSDNKGTNDDLILSCCRHYCNDRPDHLLPRELDAPLKLYREAVLITEDRNLCVKALTHHVPVRDLPSFLRWANIS